MRLPGFSAEAAIPGPQGQYAMRASYASRFNAVTMAAQCCPTGYNATGCQPNTPPSCSTMRCPQGQVCCDCTVTHCTSPAQCKHECSL